MNSNSHRDLSAGNGPVEETPSTAVPSSSPETLCLDPAALEAAGVAKVPGGPLPAPAVYLKGKGYLRRSNVYLPKI